MLGTILAVALAAAILPLGFASAEAAKRKSKNSSANAQGRVIMQDLNFTHTLDKAPRGGKLTGARRR
jgi:hypothetical protein